MNRQSSDSFYDLLEQLYTLGPSNDHLDHWTAHILNTYPFPAAPQIIPIIKKLLNEALAQIWSHPRQSWAMAKLAHLMAKKLDDVLILNESQLALGIIFNHTGLFSKAIFHLTPTPTIFQTYEQLYQACRSYSEMGLAYIYQDDFDLAETALEQAHQLTKNLDNAVIHAHYYRVRGILHLIQNRYQDAAAQFHHAEHIFVAAHQPAETALTYCNLADTFVYTDPELALKYLSQARAVSALANSSVHIAQCDNIQGFIYTRLNRYEDSIPLYRRAWLTFKQEEMNFLAARCDLNRGIAHYRLNQYDTALRLYQRARTFFDSQGLKSRVAMCDLNIANVYYDKNHFHEALTLYQEVATLSTQEKRPLRAARCYTNMGACYEQMGRYDLALTLHKQAAQILDEAGDHVMAAKSKVNLAHTYQKLGRYHHALEVYQTVHKLFDQNRLDVNLADCKVQLASLYLTLNQPQKAEEHLNNALPIYQEKNMITAQAISYRQLALTAYTQNNFELAIKYLDQARHFFIALKMPVELALCDLTEGKVHLARHETSKAQGYFQQALDVLQQGFPDYAWQAAEGLALCAVHLEEKQVALKHYIKSAGFITQTRQLLPIETLQSDYFCSRQHIFAAAINIALQLNDPKQALILVESAKSHSFLTPHNLWHLHQHSQNDPYLTNLLNEAADLNRHLENIRTQLTTHSQPAPALTPQNNESFTLKQIAQLSQDYEDVVEQIRLRTPTNQTAVKPFSIDTFRRAAAKNLGDHWVSLEYFFYDDKLIIFAFDNNSLRLHSQPLNQEDWWILHQCTTQNPERRMIVYDGTIRGFPVPGNPGQTYLQHLYKLLLPAELLNTFNWETLIIAPHDILHMLPYHALLQGKTSLIEQGAILYTPNLQLLQLLWKKTPPEDKDLKALVYGLDYFGDRAATLPNAAQEVDEIKNTLNNNANVVYGTEATLSNLRHMCHTGNLEQYNLLHFATHTIINPEAPMLSRVLLNDSDLTVKDILELKLSAQLVTLSTCHSATGKTKPGDEMMTLARAFFHAGALSVVASLWAVEDEMTTLLMQAFYQYLQQGNPATKALRYAQLKMKQAGYTPYHWAAFVIIGYANSPHLHNPPHPPA